MCLIKFEKDVINSILDSNFLKGYTLSLSNWSLVEEACIGLFNQFKNSYYFKDRYKEYSFDDTFRENLYEVIEEKSVCNINNDFNFNSFFSDLHHSLLKKDSMYPCYLETNPIRQKINLVDKFDLKYSWVSVKDESLFNTLKNYQNIDASLKFNDIKDFLNHEMGLSFIHDSQRNREFLICHNQQEIAGIASLPSSSHFKNFENRDNIKAISYIAVNNSFRGHNIGLSLFKEIFQKAKEEQWILVRTSASEDGNTFLKSKIDHFLEKVEDSIVIDHDKIIVYKDLLSGLEKEQNKHLFYKKALALFPKFNMIEQSYNDCEKALSELSEDADLNTRVSIIERRDKTITDMLKSTSRSRKCTIS